ncbi:MAG: UbiD family decarboxylase [SAR324 cluster bacterium]|nr:UbiD family decarboxylase [SAR324 cluster bacterium]
MRYQSLRQCVDDLEQHGHLLRIAVEVDPYLEMAEIQRRVYQNQGPALLFERVKGSPFPAVSNLFGTMDRARFMFRSTLTGVRRMIELKADPSQLWRAPWKYAGVSLAAFSSLPRKVSSGPVFGGQTLISKLPRIQSWPDDGGPFILLPQVFSEDVCQPGIFHSNLGMYRIQLGGNQYQTDHEIGLHYQLRRDIGIHHTHAVETGSPFRISIFVGGPPAHTLAAVMPLPEGLPEVMFAGALAGRRFRYTRMAGHVISTDADFCITGTIIPDKLLPEGPFGDHLGYYSLQHHYPVLKVESVFHRTDAIWPFTVVGRPPQEDTVFGELIHEITGPMVPVSLPGVRAIHAVDAAGVHPLMLAIGSERYRPDVERQPRELLTLANAILGFGHCSLTKYLWIVAGEDNLQLKVDNIQEFFIHALERVDWNRDLHFQTRTTMDSLDYSGSGLNSGSKVVIAAAGPKKRNLAITIPSSLKLPEGFGQPYLALPGVLVIQAPSYHHESGAMADIERLTSLINGEALRECPLLILADDSEFTGRNLNNWLWTTFTRSNPSHDIHGFDSFTDHKHWGCRGSLIIDARLKPHHAPPLIEDPEITKRVDQLGAPGKSLHGLI